jgi:hypothetical protein
MKFSYDPYEVSLDIAASIWQPKSLHTITESFGAVKSAAGNID